MERERLYHFVSKKALDIRGLGPKIIDRLVDEGLVQIPADLFLLKEDDVSSLERFKEKSAGNLTKAISGKKTIQLSRFLYALGIRHVGEETALDLARHFGTLENIRSASEDELIHIQNIGGIVAHSVYEWFRDTAHARELEALTRAGVTIAPEKQMSSSGSLAGKTFVLTGTLRTLTRDEAKKQIRAKGGKVSESVTARTQYVVAGENPGSKADKATIRNISLLTEKEFIKFLTKP